MLKNECPKTMRETREVALMIQLEQQQHGEFWVGWGTTINSGL